MTAILICLISGFHAALPPSFSWYLLEIFRLLLLPASHSFFFSLTFFKTILCDEGGALCLFMLKVGLEGKEDFLEEVMI